MDDGLLDELRLRYEANEETVEMLARAFEVSSRFVYWQAEKLGWARRAGKRRVRRPAIDTLEGRAASVYERLLARLERRLDALDADEAEEGAGKDIEERDIRALKELTGILDKLADLEAARRRTGDKVSAKGKGGGGTRGGRRGAPGDDGGLSDLGTDAFFARVARKIGALFDAGGAGEDVAGAGSGGDGSARP
jgi:hypothetical protein